MKIEGNTLKDRRLKGFIYDVVNTETKNQYGTIRVDNKNILTKKEKMRILLDNGYDPLLFDMRKKAKIFENLSINIESFLLNADRSEETIYLKEDF